MFYDAFKRHTRVWLLITVFAAVLVIGAIVSGAEEARVSARATVFVEGPPLPLSGSSLRDYCAFLYTTYVQDERTRDDIARNLGLSTLDVSVSVKPSSHGASAFDIEVVGVGVERMRRLVDAMLDAAGRRLDADVRGMVITVIERLEGELNSLNQKSLFQRRLGADADTGHARVIQLETELHRLHLLLDSPAGMLRRTPSSVVLVPRNDWSHVPAMTTLLVFALVVIVVEYLVVVAKKHRARRVVESGAGQSIIGYLPHSEFVLPLRYQPYGVAAEAYRNLRTRLVRHGYRRLLVVGWEAREGSSTISANLGLAFAELGRSVLLVDGNMRCPAQHALFGVANELGLSDVLIDTSLESAVWEAPHAALRLLTAGPAPPDASALLLGERFQLLDGALKMADADLVLIDAPALALCGDGFLLGALVDAVLFVSRPGVAIPDQSLGALRQLRRNGLPVAGLVINDVDIDSLGRASYLHHVA